MIGEFPLVRLNAIFSQAKCVEALVRLKPLGSIKATERTMPSVATLHSIDCFGRILVDFHVVIIRPGEHLAKRRHQTEFLLVELHGFRL